MTPEEGRERADRVALVLSVPCGSCHVPAGASCILARCPDQAVLQLSGSLPLFAHLMRAARAVRLGRIGRDELVAQCGGVLPDGISIG